MERDFKNSLCLATAIPFAFLLLPIAVPNAFLLIVFYRNPLRCFRKPFSVFLMFICAVDLFIGIVVCSGETMMRFLCAFSDQHILQEGNIAILLAYIGINSSILLVTGMSLDRFVAFGFPHFYLRKFKPWRLVFCNTILIFFSATFALLQLSGISMDVYRLIDQHIYATFPLCTTTLCYLGIFFILRKQSRIDLQRQMTLPSNQALHELRRVKLAQSEKKFATSSFFILLFLILSLLPCYAAIIIEVNCDSCGNQNWFYALRESCVMFLYLNSAVNPYACFNNSIN